MNGNSSLLLEIIEISLLVYGCCEKLERKLMRKAQRIKSSRVIPLAWSECKE